MTIEAIVAEAATASVAEEEEEATIGITETQKAEGIIIMEDRIKEEDKEEAV